MLIAVLNNSHIAYYFSEAKTYHLAFARFKREA